MELYKEILIHVLSEERVHDSFPNLKFDPAEITEGQCYKALKKPSSMMTALKMRNAL